VRAAQVPVEKPAAQAAAEGPAPVEAPKEVAADEH
jgi:hypothetical protein